MSIGKTRSSGIALPSPLQRSGMFEENDLVKRLVKTMTGLAPDAFLAYDSAPSQVVRASSNCSA